MDYLKEVSTLSTSIANGDILRGTEAKEFFPPGKSSEDPKGQYRAAIYQSPHREACFVAVDECPFDAPQI
jgi:hypothetical protein